MQLRESLTGTTLRYFASYLVVSNVVETRPDATPPPCSTVILTGDLSVHMTMEK